MTISIKIRNNNGTTTMARKQEMANKIDKILGYPDKDLQVSFHDNAEFNDSLGCDIIATEADFEEKYTNDDGNPSREWFRVGVKKYNNESEEYDEFVNTIIFANYE